MFYTIIQSLLYGDIDAQTAAQRIDKQYNNSIEEGVRASAPHS